MDKLLPCPSCGGDGEDRGGVPCHICMGTHPGTPIEKAAREASRYLDAIFSKRDDTNPVVSEFLEASAAEQDAGFTKWAALRARASLSGLPQEGAGGRDLAGLCGAMSPDIPRRCGREAGHTGAHEYEDSRILVRWWNQSPGADHAG